MILSYPFYNRHVVEVAQDLIGKELVFSHFRGIITETEAYRGLDDEASHAFGGWTSRSSIMFGPPGRIYVYMIYGMYYCLNIVTEPEGCPSAVLIRGLRLPDIHLDGPGKLCRHLQINKSHNGLSVIENKDIYLLPGIRVENIQATPRIGIKKAIEKPWRFLMQQEPRDDLKVWLGGLYQ